ncbi:ATP-binding protein [Pseudomonas vanderleydeniana]|uniref:histidine kinase n=1 Tax=Pseudomonas vanderleydeniana TaxID=2745495 RepID=A0A9E6PS23_9PSED|nr:ATP-binding protein [Pseudomonas vanderleydeniana]QXI31180.1 response regulator [Pseudomonas vanderleydeniana]
MTSFFRRAADVLQRLERIQLNRPTRYVGAVLVVALSCALRAQMSSTALPYLFFIPGLMLIGFWFGVGPSVLGCVLAMLAAQYFFIGPIGFEADATAWLNSLSFGLVTLGIAIVCALLRRSLRALDNVNRNLEGEVQRRTDERDGIWEASPDLICTLSGSGDVLAMNPAWQVETGWTEQQLREGAFYSLISPAQLSDALRILGERPIAELDTQSVRSNGQPLLLNWRITGRGDLYFAIARDITLYRERQNALERVSSQLQQSQKMQSLGQLTRGLAHDFNNLLTIINGTQEMIQQRLSQGRIDEIDRYVTLARHTTHRASSLTHRLLAYARKQPLNSETVDPALLIEEMKELIARTLTPQIEFELLSSIHSTLCHCDASQLETAVLNLCINARDAMPNGGRLQVEVDRLAVNAPRQGCELRVGDYVQIRVVDTGMGMPASVAERAFEPFFTTKPLGSGTGLGLSMVHDFARQARGHAQIDSVLGEGTSVSLLLPVYRGVPPAANVADVEAITATHRENRGSVLVIDDEAAIRELVGEVLQDMGYEVFEASTPDQALQRVDEIPDLQLVVTDIILPGHLDGHGVAKAAWAVRPDLKVLFISGLIDASSRVPEQPGNARLLVKPFTIQELQANVEQLMA